MSFFKKIKDSLSSLSGSNHIASPTEALEKAMKGNIKKLKDSLSSLTDNDSVSVSTDALENVVKGNFKKIKDGFASLSGNSPVTLSAEAFENALKGNKNISVRQVRPGAIDAIVKADRLQSPYTIRLVATDEGVYYDTYILNADQKSVKASVESAGLKCKEFTSGGIVLTNIIPINEVGTSSSLKKALQNLINSLNQLFIELNLTGEQLNARHFDCESLETAFKSLPGFTLKDDFGYLNYILEANGNIALRRKMYLLVEPALITVGGGQTTYNKFPFNRASAAVRKFNAGSSNVTAHCAGEYEVYFQTKIKLEDFSDEDLPRKAFQKSKQIFDETLSAWEILLPLIGLDPYAIDHDELTAKLKTLWCYEKTDDDGDSKLVIPSTKEFAGQIFVWVMPNEKTITLEAGVSNLQNLLGDEIDYDKIAEKLNKRFNDVTIKAYDDPDLRVKSEIKALEIKGNVNKAFQCIKDFTDRCCKVFEALMEEAKVDMRGFDKEEVLRVVKKLPSFAKEDDGDVRLDYSPTAEFTHSLFTWIYIYSNKIKFDSGFDNFSELTKGLDLEKAAEEFNKKSSAFAKVNEEKKYIRINTVIERSSLPDLLTESKLREVISRETENHIEDLHLLADVCRIPNFAITPETIAMALRANECSDIKTYSRSSEGKGSFCSLDISSPDLILKLRITKTFRGSESSPEVKAVIDNLKSNDCEYFTARYDKGIVVTFASPKNKISSLKELVAYIKAEIEFSRRFEELVIKANEITLNRESLELIERQVRRTEEERRRRESEARAERERKLSIGFTYTLGGGGTIRGLQEWFTDYFPFLRIGVYLVKTGKEADRSGGTIYSISSGTRFGDIRSFKGECTLSIDGRSTPESLERDFRRVSGLVIKIEYNDEKDERYYISKGSNWYKTCLFDLNNKCRELGYYKADIS